MNLARRLSASRDSRAVLFLALWPLVYFWPVTLGQGLWLGTDTLRTYLPLGVELGRALWEGRLPIWTTGIYAGFPLLGDGQIGALYPVNLLLYRLLPPFLALPYDTLIHLAWAACGIYALARAWRVQPAGGIVAGLVFSFSGFFLTRLMHASVIVTAAWLPWLIFFLDRFQRAHVERKRKAGLWLLLTSLAFAAQFLTGFPQIAFVNSLAFAVIGLCGALLWNAPGEIAHAPSTARLRSISTTLLLSALPAVLGAGIASAQLFPTNELVGFSLRGSGATSSFVTSYSLPPEYLGQFVFPFLRGEPSEANNEYLAYVGLAALVLAACAPFLRRDRWTVFLALFGLAALALALGELNPIYQLLYRLPGFGYFRAPSRYLYLFALAAALLSGIAIDELSARLATAGSQRRLLVLAATPVAAAVLLGYTQPLDFWMAAWKILPWLIAAVSALLLWAAWTRRVTRQTWQVMALALVLADLAAYAPPFLETIAPIVPASDAMDLPRSLQALDAQPLERFFSDESVFPSPPALRGSLFPNSGLLYGRSSAQAYSSLALGRHEAFLINPSPSMLDLLNVAYFMVPLEPRPADKSPLPYSAVALDATRPVTIPATAASALQVASFTEEASSLPLGTVVAQIDVSTRDGVTEAFPIRAGIETTDWDCERKSAQQAAGAPAPLSAGEQAAPPAGVIVAHSFPAFWRSLGRPFEGHTYLASFAVAPNGETRDMIGIAVRVMRPDARFTVERISLIDDKGIATSLATLVHKVDFQLAYMSDTVAAWKNPDVLPRAFVVHAAESLDDNAAFALLNSSTFRPDQTALLSGDVASRSGMQGLLSWLDPVPPESSSGLQIATPGSQPAHDVVTVTDYAPERVGISVSTDQAGYLLVDDSWYPGWSATIDGRPAPIYRADLLFRAVPLEPGVHTLVFQYRPFSLILGAALSAVSLLIALCASLLLRRQYT